MNVQQINDKDNNIRQYPNSTLELSVSVPI